MCVRHITLLMYVYVLRIARKPLLKTITEDNIPFTNHTLERFLIDQHRCGDLQQPLNSTNVKSHLNTPS